MENQKGEIAIKWQVTLRLEAFKRDLYSVDRICLANVLKNGFEVEINEEMEGWELLMRRLPEYLSDCKKFDEWFDVVAQPPFKENLTVIYQRRAATRNPTSLKRTRPGPQNCVT